MNYDCEWLESHIDEETPEDFPCEWAKQNWGKSIDEITEPFPCKSLYDKWHESPPIEYPYTMCTIGAATIPAMLNGDAHTVSPSINWLNIPPSDEKKRVLKVYGENVDVMGESLSDPVGEGLVDENGWAFHFNALMCYNYEDMSVGSTEINAYCYEDGHETGTESWDSLRIEVIGERE